MTGFGPRTAWPETLGEAVLIKLVIVVPLAVNRHSTNICDVKDVALGLGVALGLSLWLVGGLAQGRLAWAVSRLNLMVLAFVVWAGLTICYSHYWYVTLSEFGRLAAHLGLYWLAIVSLRTIGQVRRVVGAACLAAVVVCIYGFMQAAGRDPISWATPTTRIFSFLGNATIRSRYTRIRIAMARVASISTYLK